MISNRQLFYDHLAQTSAKPLALEIDLADGIYLYTPSGKRYVDMVSGVAVSNIGHRHPRVIKAINEQLEKYMHLMVYGKYIQSPQVELAKILADHLPDNLSTTYFVNSGSEAIEGAMKLSKRYTGNTEIISFKNAYHGGTQGALSVLGNEKLKNAYRPLLPDIRQLVFNDIPGLDNITGKTACVIIEPIQAEAGIILPEQEFLTQLRKKCTDTGSLLVFDEIQMGFGRSGKLFCFENYEVVPDILCLAKGMGGGMPVGAFISSKEIMSVLTNNPALGHITTFGGHPVCCAAAIANMKVIIEEDLSSQAEKKGKLFYDLLIQHPLVEEIRIKGLMLGVKLKNETLTVKLIKELFINGIIVDQFLFCNDTFRIAPPLTITIEEINEISNILIECFNKLA